MLRLRMGLILAMLPSFVSPLATWGQGRNSELPNIAYYRIFGDYYSGEYGSALRGIRSVDNRALKDADNNRFLDSVCYWTMTGECLYRGAQYADAIAQYEEAIGVYLQYQNWPTRISQMPTEILEDQAAGRRAANVPWGVSTRNARYGKFDGHMLYAFGKTDAENLQALQGGGTFAQLNLRQVDITEIMRCTALAVYRRNVIQGPASAIDPTTRQISASLMGTGGPTIPLAWPGVVKGVALFAMEDYANARNILLNSLQIGGFDHPLTPMGLLVLGHISAQASNWDEAGRYYLEASIAGVAYEQYDMVEEALHHAAVIHAASRQGGVFAPLNEAAKWAKRERADPLLTSILVDAAMQMAESADARGAASALDQAKSAMRGNDINKTELGTRWLYATTIAEYMGGDVNRGDKSFADFLQQARGTSRWLFQIALSDAAIRDNRVSERDADQLYEVLLSEPTETDWMFRPDEAMVFLATPHHEPLERWFAVTIARKAEEKAIGIAELVRRQRFFSALPMGGRLLALRWALEAPESCLTEATIKQREAIVGRYPIWGELSAQSAALLKQLEAIPLEPETATPERNDQKKLLDQLAEVTAQQELILRQIALLREPVELAFPRPMTIPAIQQKLSPTQLMVTFLRVGEVYYVMTLGNAKYAIEGSIPARDFDRAVGELLKQIGVGDRSAVYELEKLTDPEWKATARSIATMIFQRSSAASLAGIEELIVVPDGRAWYLPFEIMQKGSEDASENLVDSTRIRYAPMAALGVPDGRIRRRFPVRALVADRNFNRDPKELVAASTADVRGDFPELQPIAGTLPMPSSIAQTLLDQAIVWHEARDRSSNDPFSLSPIPVDEGKPGSSVADWMALPWRGVEQILWTGLSSEIEGNNRNRADGSELFFATTGMMASGVRTALVSRWRVGGRSTLDLSRDMLQRLQDQEAAAAWQQSLRLFRESELDLMSEPRIRPVELEEPMTADIPFFWAGYLLIDNGNATQLDSNDSGQAPDADTDGG